VTIFVSQTIRLLTAASLLLPLLAGCSSEDEPSPETVVPSGPHQQKAAQLKRSIEEAVEQGKLELYAPRMQELDSYMTGLERHEAEEFAAYWRDPPLPQWINQMAMRMSEKGRERILERKIARETGQTPAPGTVQEPLPDLVGHLVVGLIGERSDIPRIRDVQVIGDELLIAYRTDIRAEEPSADSWMAMKILAMLPYLLDHPRLADIRVFRFEAYQTFQDRDEEERVLLLKLPRKTLERIMSQPRTAQTLLNTAEQKGELSLHPRLKRHRAP
jgi:hypothetical protein